MRGLEIADDLLDVLQRRLDVFGRHAVHDLQPRRTVDQQHPRRVTLGVDGQRDLRVLLQCRVQ